MKLKSILTRTLLAGGVLTSTLSHATLIDTRPFQNGNIQRLGEPNEATYGQTITVPMGDTVLDSFSFRLDDFRTTTLPDFVDFGAYVMAWDGTKATGSVLYSSGLRSTTNNGGLGGYEEFTFSTGGLALTAGSKYVLFMSASDFFDGIAGGAALQASFFDPYLGGELVRLNNGSNFSAVTTNTWSRFSDYDLSFTASFSAPAPAPAPVPEPTTALFGLALVGFVTTARRRRAQAQA